MIGMGPYLPHRETPLGRGMELTPEFRVARLKLGLKMIALTRLQLHDVNIAATTALQALSDTGREQGLLAGANVVMPNVTDREYRMNYQLYESKPCLNETSLQCQGCLSGRIASVGEEIQWSDPEIPEGIPAISPGQSQDICPLNIQMPPPFRTSERFARRSSMSLR